uniref:Solute carrier family 27 (Fatty acid transporter), member 1/4 n=1 Tax=Rhipicephalus appendiculatus TaxID=34631 RepID=A0A131Z6R3_RHIAP
MLAVQDPERRTDLDALLAALRRQLPVYAVPLFVRLTRAVDTTSTYKLKKGELQRHEYHLDQLSGDPCFFLDQTAGRYVPLDRDLYERLCAGACRL